MDPVLGRGASKVILVDAMRRKPFVDEMDAIRLRSNESLDLLLGQVLAVALMERVARRGAHTRQTDASGIGRKARQSTYLTS